MFVAGEPGPGADPLQDVETSMARRMTGSVVGGWLSSRLGGNSSGPAPAHEPPWHLPMQQAQCVKLVLDISQSERRGVQIIDVNRPEGQERLVRQWVRPDRTLPMLVRPDGTVLQGLGEFVPGTVRRFIRGR
jgi:hypothetical protein